MEGLLLLFIITLQLLSSSYSFINTKQKSFQKVPKTIHYYDYFKKNKDGEKKDIGRLWKNIIFPGIFVEYADTKEPLKTVKVEVSEQQKKSRNDDIISQKVTTGTFNVVDEKAAPVYGTNLVLKSNSLPPVKKPANFVAPVPKKAVTVKPGTGLSVLPNIKDFIRPKKPIILYEYESDGNCRKVREACTILDLPVEFRPCPGAVSGFSDTMVLMNGQRQVPFMIDNNPSMYKPQLFGADSIIEHLFDTYGPGYSELPAALKGPGKSGGKGNKIRPNIRVDNIKMKPIVLYGWEGAQYVKAVRECLNELGLSHTFINCANGSLNRDKLLALTKGVFQVPYITDPNTGVAMFESAEIVKYLEATYTIP